MGDPVRILRSSGAKAEAISGEPQEWLVANGLGGYACSTVPGTLTRRFHGLLVAALPPPHGRTMMLNLMTEHLRLADGSLVRLGSSQVATEAEGSQERHLAEFRLEQGLPIWRFEVGEIVIERRLLMVHRQNTVVIVWALLAGDSAVELQLRPFLHFRPHEARVSEESGRPYTLSVTGDHYEVSSGGELPPLRLRVRAERSSLVLDGGLRHEVSYSIEARRGYDSRGTLWSPGYFTVGLSKGHDASLLASTEPWAAFGELRPADVLRDERLRRRELIERSQAPLHESPADELVLSADTFIIDPPRDEPPVPTVNSAPHRTVIAGYHWFTDWGRDTMISLEGLTLLTGRPDEARGILNTFAKNIRDGLIPNFFSEHEGRGLYHTADATLWFVHAIDRYLEATGDRDTLRSLLPKLIDIIRHHCNGTQFGIGMDHADGLLRQGAENYQLTWMDAKVDGWVVTPRRGKAVEINALWYNALRLLAQWVREQQYTDGVPPLEEIAERTHASFNKRFWYAEGGYLYDVVDGEHGDDASLRPNQLFAVSLRHAVLDSRRWPQVLDIVRERLLTPVGLRSLAADHPDYKPQYDGDLRARDAAYHQGTVWGWLIGPFIDAWIRVHPQQRADARTFLHGFCEHLDEACLGSISEIFDAEAPFAPRGCVAQAWSVAEFLRAWRNTAT